MVSVCVHANMLSYQCGLDISIRYRIYRILFRKFSFVFVDFKPIWYPWTGRRTGCDDVNEGEKISYLFPCKAINDKLLKCFVVEQVYIRSNRFNKKNVHKYSKNKKKKKENSIHHTDGNTRDNDDGDEKKRSQNKSHWNVCYSTDAVTEFGVDSNRQIDSEHFSNLKWSTDKLREWNRPLTDWKRIIACEK